MTDHLLLTALVVLAIVSVMAADLILSVLGLAAASAVLSIVIFRMGAPMAAVFELSVCAGLISALFVSVTGLIQPSRRQDVREHLRKKLARFWLLPLFAAGTGVIVFLISAYLPSYLPAGAPAEDVRAVLWEHRRLDMVGQVIILLAGVFGITVILKEKAE